MCHSLFIPQLCRRWRFMVQNRHDLRKYSSWTITTEQLRGKNSEERDYFKMGKLADYSVPDKVIAVATDQNPPAKFLDRISHWAEDNTLTRLGKNTYVEAFRTMIYFEEFAEQQQVDKFNLKGIKFHHVEQNEFLFFCEPGMEELSTSVVNGILNRFVLPMDDGKNEIVGSILGKSEDKIHVLLFDGIEQFSEDQMYDIIFKINRQPYQMQHKALDLVQHHKLFDALINNPKYLIADHDQSPSQNENKTDTEDEALRDLNEEQKQAVDQMVNAEYNPGPYLLYGPAGTGKTKTLVAAIRKIVDTTDKKVLVCAQSNAACDEIAERLCKFYGPEQIFRMYTTSQRADKINSSLLDISNVFDGYIEYPPLKYLYKFRVVICTLATAGCLTRAQCNPDHFSYVFIDECASAPEPLALVPIAGLCTGIEKIHANIILSGDPKQLDAISKSEWATKLGYSVSWLEQMFKFPLYKRDSVSGKFNPKYITQLVKNYRSHPAILRIANQLFYEGSLEAKVPLDNGSINNLDILPNPKFPIIFKSVQGVCAKTDNDTSSFNQDEVDAVMDFINKILKMNSTEIKSSDIGVVSPYRLQCKKIKNACTEANLDDITIGTSEVFQGQERKVVIVSTVRSTGDLGRFVRDPQRMNVMITRAKNLLIVVGDPHTLRRDSNWSEFLNYCYENGGFIQGTRKFTPSRHKPIAIAENRNKIENS